MIRVKNREKTMLDKEFKYYLDHQEELLPTYNGKYVMIVGNKVVGACNTIGEAYYRGKREYGLGNFLVQLCTPGDSAYTVTYHTCYRWNPFHIQRHTQNQL